MIKNFIKMILLLAIFCTYGCSEIENLEKVNAKADELSATASSVEDWKKVLDLTKKSLILKPNDFEILLLRGYAFYSIGKFDDAQDCFEKAKKNAPNTNPYPSYWYGWIHHRKGELGDNKAYDTTTLTELRKAYHLSTRIKDEELKKSLLIMLVNCCLITNAVGGENYIKELQKMDGIKNSPELYNARGILLLRDRKYAQAQAMFSRAHSLDKTNFIYLENLAVLSEKYLRNKEQAKKYYAAAIKVAASRKDKEKIERYSKRLRRLRIN